MFIPTLRINFYPNALHILSYSHVPLTIGKMLMFLMPLICDIFTCIAH